MKKQLRKDRTPLTNEELERLTPDEYLRVKLTDEERGRWREINQAREIERREMAAANSLELARLLSELQTAGLNIQCVSDLIMGSEPYEAAIPILLRHLLLPYSDSVKETIARALAVPEAGVREAWPILVEEYQKTPEGRGVISQGSTKQYRLGAKDGLACVLAVAVTKKTLEELIALAKDQAMGESRLLLLPALRKRRNKSPLNRPGF